MKTLEWLTGNYAAVEARIMAFLAPAQPVQVEADPLQSLIDGLNVAEGDFQGATIPADVDRAILVENTRRDDLNNHIRRQRLAQGLPVTDLSQFRLPWLNKKGV
jgi:hypothetical protein